MPLTSSIVQQMMARFRNFYSLLKKSRLGLKRGKKAQYISNRCKDLFKRKKYFGKVLYIRNVRILQQPFSLEPIWKPPPRNPGYILLTELAIKLYPEWSNYRIPCLSMTTSFACVGML